MRGDEGYLIVYREHNDRSEARLRLWNVAGRTIHCTLIAGQGQDFSAAVDASGEVAFTLDRPFSFALYAYRINPRTAHRFHRSPQIKNESV